MTWTEMPRLFPQCWTWGCELGAYQYVLGFNADTRLWSLSAKVIGEGERERIDLGFDFASAAEAEAACQAHAKRVAQ